MKHTTVIEFLTQYGEVQSVTRERWKNFFPGVYNGVRILHMKLTKPIPSFVTISGHMTSISYPGQQKTCRWCEKAAHPGQKCNVSENHPQQTSSPQTVVSSNENAPLLSPDHFPPIYPVAPIQQIEPLPTTRAEIQQKPSTSKNDINDDGDNDGYNSTSSGSIETPNKRRRSARLANERKKLCASQASLDGSQSSVDKHPWKKGFSSDKKSPTEYNYD